VILAGVPRFIEHLVRLVAGEALIPKVNGQTGQFAKLGRKNLGFGGLRAQLPGKVKRIAHHDSGHGEAPRQPRQRAEILARIAIPLQGENRLHRDAEFVADGNANAPIADVEGQIAGMGSGFQVAFLGVAQVSD
jgi:hypothetical protein